MSQSADTKQRIKALVPINAISKENFQELFEKIKLEELDVGNYVCKRGDSDKNHIYILSGAVELISSKGIEFSIRSGTDEALHPIAHSIPRRYSARVKKKALCVYVDSNLLDIMLTWDQTGGYRVEDLEVHDQEDDNDWMTKILQTKAFHRVPAANIQAMFMRMENLPCHPGQVVIQQGDPGDKFYMVKEGRFLVTRVTPKRPEGIKLAELGVGDSFGEEALISNTARNATITALTRGSLMALSKDDFISLLNEPMQKWVSFDEGIKMLANQKAEWLDVRLPTEYENRRIHNSKNIPLVFLRMKINTLDPGRKYIVYCDTGRRSSAAAFLLSERGYDTYVLKDGLSHVPNQALEGIN